MLCTSSSRGRLASPVATSDRSCTAAGGSATARDARRAAPRTQAPRGELWPPITCKGGLSEIPTDLSTRFSVPVLSRSRQAPRPWVQQGWHAWQQQQQQGQQRSGGRAAEAASPAGAVTGSVVMTMPRKPASAPPALPLHLQQQQQVRGSGGTPKRQANASGRVQLPLPRAKDGPMLRFPSAATAALPMHQQQQQQQHAQQELKQLKQLGEAMAGNGSSGPGGIKEAGHTKKSGGEQKIEEAKRRKEEQALQRLQRVQEVEQQQEVEVDLEDDERYARGMLLPVFRRSTYSAEFRRRAAGETQTRIVFVDEGNSCRSVLAEAILRSLLDDRPLLRDQLFIEALSIGPCFGGDYDPRVEAAAEEAGLQLPPRVCRVFNETEDIVAFDLVLVMDRFDYDEVLREVAVFDRINPGGSYSVRVKQLGGFAASAPSGAITAAAAASAAYGGNSNSDAIAMADRGVSGGSGTRGDSGTPDEGGVSDPLYYNFGGVKEEGALREAVGQLRLSCLGLVEYLEGLRQRLPRGERLHASLARCVASTTALPLSCELQTSGGGRAAGAGPQYERTWQPVWMEPGSMDEESDEEVERRDSEGGLTSGGDGSGSEAGGRGGQQRQHGPRRQHQQHMYTLRERNGRQEIVRSSVRQLLRRKHRHWLDFRNTEDALRAWMERHRWPDPRLMPPAPVIREAGDYWLVYAITLNGGFAEVAQRMGLSTTRHARCYWDSWENLKAELEPLLIPAATTSSSDDGSDGSGGDGGSEEAVETKGGDCSSSRALVMPTQKELRQLGRSDILTGIRRHGGTEAVAARLGASCSPPPGKCGWTQQAVHAAIRSHLQSLPEGSEARMTMPSRSDLAAAGCPRGLANAVQRLGGFRRVANDLGLLPPLPEGGWSKQAVHAAIREHLELHGSAQGGAEGEAGRPSAAAMPTRSALLRAGRPASLVNAIQRMGGFKRVAAELGLRHLNAGQGPRRKALGAQDPTAALMAVAVTAVAAGQRSADGAEAAAVAAAAAVRRRHSGAARGGRRHSFNGSAPGQAVAAVAEAEGEGEACFVAAREGRAPTGEEGGVGCGSSSGCHAAGDNGFGSGGGADRGRMSELPWDATKLEDGAASTIPPVSATSGRAAAAIASDNLQPEGAAVGLQLQSHQEVEECYKDFVLI